MSLDSNVGLYSEDFEGMALEMTKIAVWVTTLSMGYATEPTRISAWTLNRLKVEFVGYILAADSACLCLLSHFRGELRKT